MSPIAEILSYLSMRSANNPKVLLICGGQFSNAVGDTVTFAHHHRYLTSVFGAIRLTVWTADSAVWKFLCGDEVRCTPFVERQEAVHDQDIVIFDWVTVGNPVDQLFADSDSVLIEFNRPGASMRYRLRGQGWRLVRTPPTPNNVRRIAQGYSSLGVVSKNRFIAAGGHIAQRSETRNRIYLNPYGSTPEKCLDAELLNGLIKEISERFGDGQTICPSVPVHLPPEGRSTFERLAARVKSAALAGNVLVVEPMTVVEYLQYIRDASVVIGSDTSSQHVANYFGVPSVACYPANSGYRFYYWGCPGPKNLCFRAPSQLTPTDPTQLAAFVSFLAERLLSATPTRNLACDAHCEKYEYICNAILRRTVSGTEGAPLLSRCIDDLESMVSERWRPFLFPELRQIAHEVCTRSLDNESSNDELGMDRLSDIYALKAIRLLFSGFQIDNNQESSRDQLTNSFN